MGPVNNYKSMAYIGNIAEFIKYKLKNITKGYEVYNYVDKPDLNMNQLMAEIEKRLRKKVSIRAFALSTGHVRRILL